MPLVKVSAFNNDSVVTETVIQLIKDLNIDCIIETGTFRGTTTAFLSETFPSLPIYTVEVDFKQFLEAEANLKPYSNVKVFCGSSEKVLDTLLPTLQEKRILFYLDAHWEEYWPLLDEMETISKNCKDNCCIVIDDFKVPYRNFQHDGYKNQSLDLNYIEGKMNKVYKTPYYFFNDRSTREGRAVGKIYIVPNEWKSKVTIKPKEENGYFYVQ